MRDNSGQPINSRFNAKMRVERETDELLGLCKGIVSDGIVNQAEAEFLAEWLKLNSNSSKEWPANVLYDRIGAMLVDGQLDSGEEGELLSLLVKVAGGNPCKLNAHSLTAGLPLNDPQPPIIFSGMNFCFTGKFLLGSRDYCHQEVALRGGICTESITKNLNYLVIGVVGSRDWAHSTFGRKIQKAVEYREKASSLAIVSEENFIRVL